MILAESIATNQRVIEVPASLLCQTLIEIRSKGGHIPSMDVDRVTYTLHIYWDDEPQQKELI